MKKVLYIVLLFIELVLDVLLMSLLWSNQAWLAWGIIAVVWGGLLIWQVLALKKVSDDISKKRIYRRIALSMLVPIVGFIIVVIWFIIALSRVI